MKFKTNILGRTGLRISEFGYGCGGVGGLFTNGTEKDQIEAVKLADRFGINYFDTAPSYGNGLSEKNLGKYLKYYEGVPVIGTKVDIYPDHSDISGDIVQSVKDSLRRLGLKQVDIAFVHNRLSVKNNGLTGFAPVEAVVDKAIPSLEKLKSEGLVKHTGFTAIGENQAIDQVIETGYFDSLQLCYNLLNPTSGDWKADRSYYSQNFNGLIRKANKRGMGVFAVRVFAGGALSGSMDRDPVAKSVVPPFGTSESYQEDVKFARYFEFLVNEGYSESIIECATRFPLGNKQVTSSLLGFSNLGQIHDAVRAAEKGPLSSTLMGRLEETWKQFVKN